MRIALIFTLLAVCSACEGDPRPVYGTGVWRFHDANAFDPSCQSADQDRTITGEHGDESPSGGTLLVKCSASETSSGDLLFNLTLEDGTAGDAIDIRALRIPAVYLTGASPIEANPTQCDSILFEVSGTQYQALCTGSEPVEGECQLMGAVLDEGSSSISIEFSCHNVPTLGGGSSVCDVSGGGTSDVATLEFDGCSGF